MMYYLSGLQQIPADLYESASIDGATSMEQLRYITIPLLKPTTIYVLTISIFGGMAMFSESYMLFNGNNRRIMWLPHWLVCYIEWDLSRVSLALQVLSV